jgi:Zn-finger nucleic acid-binding protein
MDCPVCHTFLNRVIFHDMAIDSCNQCGGLWFDEGELKDYIRGKLFERRDIPESPIELNKNVVGTALIKEPAKSCPHCHQSMQSFNYCYDSNVILDKCPECSGIWVDGGEFEKMVQYHKVNPDLIGMGEGIAQQVNSSEKFKQMAERWKYSRYRGGWYWFFHW